MLHPDPHFHSHMPHLSLNKNTAHLIHCLNLVLRLTVKNILVTKWVKNAIREGFMPVSLI